MRDACAREGLRLTVPPPRLCTDNAAMIACAGYYHLIAGQGGWAGFGHLGLRTAGINPMRFRELHSWDMTAEEARAQQTAMRAPRFFRRWLRRNQDGGRAWTCRSTPRRTRATRSSSCCLTRTSTCPRGPLRDCAAQNALHPRPALIPRVAGCAGSVRAGGNRSRSPLSGWSRAGPSARLRDRLPSRRPAGHSEHRSREELSIRQIRHGGPG